MDDVRDVWIKLGDQTEEGEALIQLSGQQNGGVVGTPDLRKSQTPDGSVVTVLSAVGLWWREHMRVHGVGWKHMSEDQLADYLDALARTK